MSQTEQPQIDATGTPDTQCRLGDVIVDVWSDWIGGRCSIEGVAIAGTRVDIVSMLTDAQLNNIRAHCELTLPTPEEPARDFAEDMAFQRMRDREAA